MGRIRRIKPELLPMQQEPPGDQHYLYVLQEAASERFFKIGHAGHPRRRLSSLQAGNYRKLRIVACYSGPEAVCRWLELETLSYFGARPGSEWVKAPLSAITVRIEVLCEALG